MRNQSDSIALRNEYLLEIIKDIKAEHPFWGYRRIWAYLRYVDGLIVNEKRVYRLMRERCVPPRVGLGRRRSEDTS
ncbi:MAG: IS3 family transposase [Thermodesulfobacteriota bacterium]